ncbi:DUF3090 domain-containing protein [Curtobacterium ammoniigenes]|uniref:DUF3090 domain-containing protein n=1 Tax=Curtobacterium ammoniigenes TaxID=395387 RepID=UPI00082D0D73|nr:DUF3090 domain-containing protein [Curtobacterium ammoniigenes]
MPTIVYGFDWPDRFVVGTIGEPGARAFYMQARAGNRVTSVALEKEQSEVLAEKLDELLDELMQVEGNRHSVPAQSPRELIDDDPLDQPVEPEFRAGTMSLGWDPSTAQVVIEAYPLDDANDEPESVELFGDAEHEPSEMLQVRIPVGTARAFAKRTLSVVGAGRPRCPLCGRPLEPVGHICIMPGDDI